MGCTGGRPLTLWQATLFQFVNPKAWIINVAAVATFTLVGDDYWISTLLIAAIFGLVMLNTLPFWTAFGCLIVRCFASPVAHRRLNQALGLSTAASVAMILN